MAVLFALIAAACYGVSDFAGGLASRRARPSSVLLYNYPAGALLMAALLPLLPGTVSVATLGWSVAGGVAGLIGVGMMYSALAVAPMNVVSPVTALLSAAVPVVVGVGLGERPGVLTWAGVAAGLVAVVLIARAPEDHPSGSMSRRALTLTLLAGCGFGVYFVCLARAPADSGLWPVVLSRVTAAVVVSTVVFGGVLRGRAGSPQRAPVRLSGRTLALALGSGMIDAGANLFFLLASRHGYLSISSVITALYPAGTVLLAVGVLKERVVALQRWGFGLAVVAVVLIAG